MTELDENALEAARNKGREIAGNQPGALVEAMGEIAVEGAKAYLSALPEQEPAAYVFELAKARNIVTGEYCNWGKPQLSFTPPCAGDGQRNVTPLFASPVAHPLRDEEVERLTRERDEARGLVTEANNSLYGSQGYFHSMDGGPFDRNHLAKGIEALKSRVRKMGMSLASIAHTVTETSYGDIKDMPASWFRQQARSALDQDLKAEAAEVKLAALQPDRAGSGDAVRVKSIEMIASDFDRHIKRAEENLGECSYLNWLKHDLSNLRSALSTDADRPDTGKEGE